MASLVCLFFYLALYGFYRLTMAVCTSLDGNNYVQANATSPDSCTGYLLVTPAEFAGFQPIRWTMEEANSLVIVTFSIWGTAWLFKQVMRFILNR